MDLIIISIVLVFIVVSLYVEIVGPAFTFLIGVIILGVFGILTPIDILSGMANEQIAVIILLQLMGDIIRKTDLIDNVFNKIFRDTSSYKGFLSKMIVVVAGFSAFLNNTPLVAIMMPYVHRWSRRNQIYRMGVIKLDQNIAAINRCRRLPVISNRKPKLNAALPGAYCIRHQGVSLQ